MSKEKKAAKKGTVSKLLHFIASYRILLVLSIALAAVTVVMQLYVYCKTLVLVL